MCSDFVEIVFSKSVKIQCFCIYFSEIQEIRDFKKPYKTWWILHIFDIQKQKYWKNVGFYRLFENNEISNVKITL